MITLHESHRTFIGHNQEISSSTKSSTSSTFGIMDGYRGCMTQYQYVFSGLPTTLGVHVTSCCWTSLSKKRADMQLVGVPMTFVTSVYVSGIWAIRVRDIIALRGGFIRETNQNYARKSRILLIKHIKNLLK